ncbi:hypothetical protein OG462_32785 [Streptomyces sp. NBC_01077]|uniref:hypothetical protein n=1 Tax=Streptomyces sp. NBC_01077 TaxID=2903746 RepID=UPI00386D13D6|nr:hypothetical protein OG462_32785 [Streptomyces sp. NBC_01077]
MITHTMRALCAATLVIAPVALTATPAYAATSCRVNGVAVNAQNIVGTPGADYITCGSVPNGDSVNGQGGADYIVITGTVGGTVRGSAGGDYIQVYGSVTSTGAVRGDEGNDYVRVGANGNVVDGGLGTDFCRVASGNPPVNCES